MVFGGRGVEIETRVGKAFFKTERDGESPSNTKDPLQKERVLCYLNSDEFLMVDPQ